MASRIRNITVKIGGLWDSLSHGLQNTKHHSQDRRSLSQFIPWPPEYETGLLNTRPRCTLRGMEVKLHVFLKLALDLESSASHSFCFTSSDKNPRIGTWHFGEENFQQCREFNTGILVVQPSATHFILITTLPQAYLCSCSLVFLKTFCQLITFRLTTSYDKNSK
jgi:hypothetical protein